MSENKLSTGTADDAPPATCAQCEKPIRDEDAVESGGRRFCPSCYAELRVALERAVYASSVDVNYPMAVVGAALGGLAGALVWWGFTIVTHVAFGLVAVAIGFLAGHGAMRLAGNKRTVALQVVAASVAAASFAVASYLVNMTLVNEHLAKTGEPWRLGFPPETLDQAFQVVALDFGIMDAVFLLIVISQAWSIPRPLRLPTAGA